MNENKKSKVGPLMAVAIMLTVIVAIGIQSAQSQPKAQTTAATENRPIPGTMIFPL
jgi:hypothetical protein